MATRVLSINAGPVAHELVSGKTAKHKAWHQSLSVPFLMRKYKQSNMNYVGLEYFRWLSQMCFLHVFTGETTALKKALAFLHYTWILKKDWCEKADRLGWTWVKLTGAGRKSFVMRTSGDDARELQRDNGREAVLFLAVLRPYQRQLTL